MRTWKEQEIAQVAVLEMDVRASSIAAAMKTLSGGNQQKALLARWMLAKPIVAIFDEPTRGVDIGAKESIYFDHRLARRERAGRSRDLIGARGTGTHVRSRLLRL